MSKEIFRLNSVKNVVDKILNGIEKSNFHCPCSIQQTETNKCNFNKDYLPETITEEELCIDGQNETPPQCKCGLYKRIED